MKPEQWEWFTGQELAFFAKISASVTHEIKNHLAIINEQNGLLGDMLEMDDEGGPGERDRLGRVVRDVTAQVAKTDAVVRRFNAFAHTADTSIGSVDVRDFLNLLTEVTARMIRCKGVVMAVEPGPECVTIHTRPFEFLHLLHCCSNRLLAAGVPGGKRLLLRLEPRNGQIVRVWMRLDAEAAQNAEGYLPPLGQGQDQDAESLIRLLLHRLQARLDQPGSGTGMALDFPVDLAPVRN